MATFAELGLSDKVLKVLAEMGFETPSEIQEKSIPILLESERNFIGLAQTGTGKTAAFGLPILEHIDPQSDYTQALVLAPTRELGKQIAEQLNKFSTYLTKVNVLAVYGGADIRNQMKDLKRTQHIIIATPGRLIDLIKRKAVFLDQLKYLVLDEADEMLNMGFKDELEEILAYTPAEKLTYLFSATMPSEISRIVKKFITNPVEVRINPTNEVNVNIEHQYIVVKNSNKDEAMMRFLDMEPNMRAIVFCRTRMDTKELAEFLFRHNYKADAIHGDLTQAQRDRVMQRFKRNELQVMIATDVAARGIDVNDLTHVFHYTLPDDNAYYTHRSGRTARAGKKGISISIISNKEVFKIKRLEKQLGISIEKVLIPDKTTILNTNLENWCVDVLESSDIGGISKELQGKALNLFANLSKEELVSKLLAFQFGKMTNTDTSDLNDYNVSNQSSGGGDRGGRGGRSGGRDRRSSGGNDSYSRDRKPRTYSDKEGRSSDKPTEKGGYGRDEKKPSIKTRKNSRPFGGVSARRTKKKF